MKNIFYSFLMILVIWGGSSCTDDSFLDETVTTDLDYQTVFSDSLRTEAYLAEIYRELGFDVRPDRYSYQDLGQPRVVLGGLQTTCDEAEYRTAPRTSADQQFARGIVNPVVINDDAWRIPFENIRRVNMFNKGLDEVSKMVPSRKKYLKAEARFMRAWYYATMVRHYGGVPIIGDSIYSADDSFDVERRSFEDCINYIVEECEGAIADGLRTNLTGREYGRVTVGAARGLISRMKLYAASPLYNGTNMASGECPAELIGYPTADPNRWQEALDAAYAVISSRSYYLYENHTNVSSVGGGVPDPGFGFYAIFVAAGDDQNVRSDGAYNETLIADRSLGNRAAGAGREGWFQPPSRSESTKCGFAYQNLVDAFPMSDGKPIMDAAGNPINGYDPQNPYVNRDPRLHNTVLYNGMAIPSGNDVGALGPISIHINADGTSGQDAVYKGTPTGYYISKLTHRYRAANGVHGYDMQTPLIRYAEILLNYCEAANELKVANGSGYDVSSVSIGNRNEPMDVSGTTNVDVRVYQMLMWLRRRAGINGGNDDSNPEAFGLKQTMTALEMREFIRNERRIELAVEGHRFFDVRRWKIAEETENQPMYGMEVRLASDGTRIYTKFLVRTRSFRNAMYFWPIPYRETIKSPSIVQNPGYNM